MEYTNNKYELVTKKYKKIIEDMGRRGDLKMSKKKKLGLFVVIATMLTIVLTVGMAVKTKKEAQAKFYFSRIKIKKCSIKLDQTNFEWDGQAKRPAVTVTYYGQELEKDVDYVISYYNNVDAGRGYVRVKGIGEFRGAKNIYFYINGIDINRECTFKLSGTQIYVYYKGELLDPDNYTVDVSKTEAVEYSDEISDGYYRTKYLIVTTYRVTGRGQFYGYHDEQVVSSEIRYEHK